MGGGNTPHKLGHRREDGDHLHGATHGFNTKPSVALCSPLSALHCINENVLNKDTNPKPYVHLLIFVI